VGWDARPFALGHVVRGDQERIVLVNGTEPVAAVRKHQQPVVLQVGIGHDRHSQRLGEATRDGDLVCHLGARGDANGVWQCGGFRSSHRYANEHHVARAIRGLDIDLDAGLAFRMPKL